MWAPIAAARSIEPRPRSARRARQGRRAAARRRRRRAGRPRAGAGRQPAPAHLRGARVDGADVALRGAAAARSRRRGPLLPALRRARGLRRRHRRRAPPLRHRARRLLRRARCHGGPSLHHAAAPTISWSSSRVTAWSRSRQPSACSSVWSATSRQRHARAGAGRLRHGLRPGACAPARPDRGSVADIAPTILYFLGLPIGRDMDGTARADFFQPSFTATRPVTFIPSYGR